MQLEQTSVAVRAGSLSPPSAVNDPRGVAETPVTPMHLPDAETF